MVKCPFCSFGNEDGALFCEQCKSDISNVAPTPLASAAPPPTPMPDSLPPGPMMEAPVMAAIVEEAPVEVIPLAEEPPPVPAEVIPLAAEEAPPAPLVEEAPLAAAVVEAPVAAPIAPPVAEPPPPAAKPAAAAAGAAIPAGATPKLVVQRGLKIGEEYSIFPGENYVGRADEKPVDVDLTFQEPEDRVWTSRQHALLVWDDAAGALTIEDLNSSNGTFVNRERVYPGQPRQLFAGNTIQIGTVHLKIKV